MAGLKNLPSLLPTPTEEFVEKMMKMMILDPMLESIDGMHNNLPKSLYNQLSRCIGCVCGVLGRNVGERGVLSVKIRSKLQKNQILTSDIPRNWYILTF